MADYNVTVSLGGVGATATSGIFNVLDYGAARDGSTDDSTAIQAAIDACEAAGRGTVKIPAGEYYVGSTLTVDRGSDYAADRASVIEIDATGATIEAPITLDAPILRIGAAANRNRNIHLVGGSFQFAAYNWDSGASCVELYNAYNCQVSNVRVRHGYSGIRLRSDGTGCVYNNINDVYSTDCLNAFHLTRDDTDGWVNENIFTGGGCAYTSSCPDASSGNGLSLTVASDSGGTMNNNKFIGLSLECGMSSDKPGAVYDQRGYYNLFVGLRYEGFDTPYYSFGTSTDSNTIIGGYVNSTSDIIAAASQTKATIITGDQVFFSGGTSTVAPLTVANNSSSNYPAFMVRNATNTNTEFTIYGEGTVGFDPGSAHSAPVEGMVYYDGTANKLKVYTGSAWETITSST